MSENKDLKPTPEAIENKEPQAQALSDEDIEKVAAGERRSSL